MPGSTTLFSFVQNVDRTRARGMELVADQYDAFIPGLELSGSLTAVDGRTVRDSAFAAAVNKCIPQLPKLRANALATYRPDDAWAFTLGARYSDRSFGTIDNSDPVSQTYQGFAGYFVLDARVRYQRRRKLDPVGRRRQSQQRQIFPVPSLPAADLRDGGALCAIGRKTCIP